MFTIKGCSLIRGVHYERFHCSRFFDELVKLKSFQKTRNLPENSGTVSE